MKYIKKWICVLVAFLSLILGLIGILIPVFPTTPFLILSSICFLNGSDRFYDWFIGLKLYKKYVKDFIEKKGLTLKRKVCILLVADFLIIVSMIIVRNFYMSIFLLGIICFKFWYFIFRIKTLKDDSELDCIDK